jgi:hypothetical protein
LLRPSVAALALAALLAVPSAAEAQRGPSTPAERKRAVEVTRRLERQPLGRDAEASRTWLFQWIGDIPDIQVRICSGPLDALGRARDERHGRILYLQSLFGMAAFLVENPAKADDWLTVQTAGVESTLRAYESVLKAERAARWPELDALLAARRAGKLRAVLEEQMASCGDESGPAPGDAI